MSFSSGNAAYAAATGVVGGFSLGALPAVAIQLGVTSWIAYEQIKATHKGEGYHTPFRRLALANWSTAAALVCGAVATAGTPLAIAVAVLPAAVLAGWGYGHWQLGHMIGQIEKLSVKGKAAGLTEVQIGESIAADSAISRLSNQFQMLYGAADIGAITTAAMKGESVQAVMSQTLHGLLDVKSAIPLAIFALGITKAFSKRARRIIDKAMPGFRKISIFALNLPANSGLRHAAVKTSLRTSKRARLLGQGMSGTTITAQTSITH